MSLERLMNCVWHRDIPQRPASISVARWDAMVKSAENRLKERLKSFMKRPMKKRQA
jgi:hypothetical protein